MFRFNLKAIPGSWIMAGGYDDSATSLFG